MIDKPFYFLFLLSVVAAGFTRSAEAQTEAAAYPPLRAQMNQWNCDDPKAPPETFCRIKQMPAADNVRSRLASGTRAWSENDALTIAYQSKADAVEVIAGGVTYPLMRVGGTDFWAIVLKAPRLQNGVVSFRFLNAKGDNFTVDPPQSRFVWRGANAPAPPEQSKPLRGRIIEEKIESAKLPEPRSLTIYQPPLAKGERPAVVIYAADGRIVNTLAPYVDALIVAQKLPPVLLVGVHSAERLPDPDPQISDVRGSEYLIGFGKTPERFEKHESFFVDEVAAWAESKYDAPKEKEKRGIFGISNGGAFAIATGAKHFDKFGHVFGFSNDSKLNLLAPAWSAKRAAPSYYLVAGLWEFRVRGGLSAYAETLRTAGANVTYVEPVAEHDPLMWEEQFVEALLLHFGGKAASPVKASRPKNE